MALILNKILEIKKLHYFDPRYNLKKIKNTMLYFGLYGTNSHIMLCASYSNHVMNCNKLNMLIM